MLAEHWNGSTWTIQATPSPAGSLGADLAAVACPSTTTCIGVGANTNSNDVEQAVAEHWNGSRWTLQTVASPSGAPNADFSGISCTSTTSCTAVGGEQTSGGVERPLAEHWNGSTWAIQATPVPSGAEESQLGAVSCASAANCTAVGDLTGAASYIGVVAEHWNGKTWTAEDVPNPDGANPGDDSIEVLDSVSCRSATSCTAVGFNSSGDSPEQALAEHWNGSSWTIQATPSTNGGALTSVSCVSATACTAAGSTDSATSTLAEQWNGSSWTIQSTPNVTGEGGDLDAISCVSATTCTAVGGTDNSTLAERSS
jgi:hypothetical protein